MNKKMLFLTILLLLLCLLDLSLSSITHLYLSIGFLTYVLARLAFPYIFYFAFISGIILDLIFNAYLGPFLIVILLLAFIVYIIKTFYSIKHIMMQSILLLLFFLSSYLLGKNFNANTITFIITVPFAFIWYLFKFPIEIIKNERE